MLVLLAITTAITLLLGGFMPLFSIASGLMFLYYLALFFGMKFIGSKVNRMLILMFSILFTAPIALLVIAPEPFLNFLMQGIHLDMK